MKKWKLAVMGTAIILALGNITACGAGTPKEESGAVETSAQEESRQVQETSEQAQEESGQVHEESEQAQEEFEQSQQESESSEASMVTVVTMEETRASVIRMEESETREAAEPQGQSTSEKSEARKAYRTFLEEQEKINEGDEFALLDIDQDGVEELIYCYRGRTWYDVYAYEAGQVKNIYDSGYGSWHSIYYSPINKRLYEEYDRRFYCGYSVLYKEDGTWKGDGIEINMYLLAGEGHDGYFLSLEEMRAEGYDLAEIMECPDEESAIEAYYSDLEGFNRFVEAHGDPIKGDGWTDLSIVDNTQENRDRLLN